MSLAKYLYRKSDNRFLSGGFFDVQPPMVAGPNDALGKPTQVPDWTNFGVAEFGDADQPRMDRDLYDATAPTKRRLMTAAELNAVTVATKTTFVAAESRKIDVLTMIAFIVRRSNVAGWDTMTSAQKKTAVLAAADQWRDLRAVIEGLVS